MDRSHRNRLLREALRDPGRMLANKKFWRLQLWPHYLRRCNEILFGDPQAAVKFARHVPQLAAKIAEEHPTASGADLMLLAHSYLGSAYRGIGDYDMAAEAFAEAARYRASASPKALAEHLRRLAYLLMVQHDPDCFPSIGEAILIHKRGNLVDRHPLGECLVCRGHAFVEFGQIGKSFDDWTAALNHISIRLDHKPYYSALHNLAVWAVEHGSDEQLEAALGNLKPALVLLNSCWGRPYPKLMLRWLIALLQARLGAYGRAELVYQSVREGLVKLNLAHEIGMLQVDLGLLYLAQGRVQKLQALARETAEIFRRLEAKPAAFEALELWCQAPRVSEALLKQVREMFATQACPVRALAA